jgi:hypothetical protein
MALSPIPELPSGAIAVGAVVSDPEGIGISGTGTTVGLVLEEGTVVFGSVLAVLRHPVKRVAVRTRIRTMILAFFIFKSSYLSEYIASIAPKSLFTPINLIQMYPNNILILWIAFFRFMGYNRKS